MASTRDEVNGYDVSPEAVGEDRATRRAEESGVKAYPATQLKLWGSVLVLLLAGIAAVVYFANVY